MHNSAYSRIEARGRSVGWLQPCMMGIHGCDLGHYANICRPRPAEMGPYGTSILPHGVYTPIRPIIQQPSSRKSTHRQKSVDNTDTWVVPSTLESAASLSCCQASLGLWFKPDVPMGIASLHLGFGWPELYTLPAFMDTPGSTGPNSMCAHPAPLTVRHPCSFLGRFSVQPARIVAGSLTPC